MEINWSNESFNDLKRFDCRLKDNQFCGQKFPPIILGLSPPISAKGKLSF